MKNKHNSGITLIALVITIVILLVLSAIALNTLMGEAGLIAKGRTAREETNKAQAKESIEIILSELRIKANEENITYDIEYIRKNIDDCVKSGKEPIKNLKIEEETAEYQNILGTVEYSGEEYEYTIYWDSYQVVMQKIAGGKTILPEDPPEVKKELKKVTGTINVSDGWYYKTPTASNYTDMGLNKNMSTSLANFVDYSPESFYLPSFTIELKTIEEIEIDWKCHVWTTYNGTGAHGTDFNKEIYKINVNDMDINATKRYSSKNVYCRQLPTADNYDTISVGIIVTKKSDKIIVNSRVEPNAGRYSKLSHAIYYGCYFWGNPTYTVYGYDE